MATVVEDPVRNRGIKKLLGLDPRLWLLTLLGTGVGIVAMQTMYTDNKAKEKDHSDKSPKLAA